MNKKTKTVAVFLVLALAVVMALTFRVYVVADGSGAEVFWRGEEAYLFVGDSHTGYHFRALEYPFVLLAQYFYYVPSPKNDVASTLVISVTPSGAENHMVNYGEWPAHAPLFLTPFGDGFYAMCPGGVLCKWAGDRFQPVTEEERQRFGGVDRLARGGFSELNGWHARAAGLPGDHFEVQIGKDLVVSVSNRATNPRAHPWVSIDLLRAGQPTQSLYNVDGTPRMVSKSEYEQTFKEHR
ncbi:MAG TPA: hypothetical protein VNY24_19155 [Candidatus Acidoferrales bacterium]|jgi:hypothetical protein|nr:hypothetical protein [Candidatus Acidoferrales bacterium]